MRRVRRVNGRITKEFEAAADAWRAAYPKLVSDGYWRDQFGEDVDALSPDEPAGRLRAPCAPSNA